MPENNEDKNIKTQYFPYKLFKNKKAHNKNNSHSENSTTDTINVSKFKNNIRWASTNTEYYFERFKYYYNTYVPDILSYSETNVDKLRIQQQSDNLKNERDQRQNNLAENLNNDVRLIGEKALTCKKWYGTNKEVLNLEFQRGSLWYNYQSELDIEELYNELCNDLQCSSSSSNSITIPKNWAVETIQNNNANSDIQLKYTAINDKLESSKQETYQQLKKADNLQKELSICKIDLTRHQKLEVKNLNQPEINKRFGGLFHSKKKPSNINKNPEEHQRDFYERQMELQNKYYRDSLRFMNNLPKQNLISRVANKSRNFISNTLSALLLQLVMLVISLTITIWILNLFKSYISDGLEKLSNRKKKRVKTSTRRRDIHKKASSIAEYLGPIASVIKILRGGGGEILLRDVFLDEITNQELVMFTSPVTYTIKREKTIKQIEIILKKSNSTRETLKCYTIQPINRITKKVKSSMLSNEIMLILFSCILILSNQPSPVKRNSYFINNVQTARIQKHYKYENIDETATLLLKTSDQARGSIRKKLSPTKNKTTIKKNRSQVKRFIDLPRLEEYENNHQITENCHSSTRQPIKITH